MCKIAVSSPVTDKAKIPLLKTMQGPMQHRQHQTIDSKHYTIDSIPHD